MIQYKLLPKEMAVFTVRLLKLHRTTRLYNVRGVAATNIGLPAHIMYKNASVVPVLHRKFVTETWQIRKTSEQVEVDEIDKDSFPAENSFAHKVLRSSDKYNISKPPKLLNIISDDEVAELIRANWKFMSSELLANNFKKLVSYIHNNSESMFEPKYANVVNGLINNIHRLTDSELREVLQYLQVVNNAKLKREQSYESLLKTLDRECAQRYMHWSPEEFLLTADLWCQLGKAKTTHFLLLALNRLGNKPNRLTSTHLVHFMFFLNIARKPSINMYEIEYRLESCLNNLSLDELGVVAMGFFKTQTHIRNSNVITIYLDKVKNNVRDIHEITLASIMKFLRYNMTYKHTPLFRTCLQQLIPEIPRLSLLSLLHVAHAAASLQVYEAELMDKIIARFEDNIDAIRIKDIERILYVLTIFNYDKSHSLYEKFIKELNRPDREQEINNFGKAFICALHYLAIVNLYPSNLIERALNDNFIWKTYKMDAYKLNREILFLDRSIEVELPDYTGPRLSAAMCKPVVEKTRWTLKAKNKQSPNNTDVLLFDVASMCKEILGFDSAVIIDQVLPHYTKPDIFICLDENKKAMPIEPLLAELPFGSIKRAPEVNLKNSKWIAVISGGPNCYLRNSVQLAGLTFCKIRQLRRIGYTPSVVPYFEWCELHNDEAKRNYIKRFVLNWDTDC